MFIALFAQWQIRRTLGPLEQLTQGARKLAAGDIGTRVDVRSADEIGILAGVFNDTLRLQGSEHRVDASAGTLSPQHGVTRDALMRCADVALYAAKAAGRGPRHVLQLHDRRRGARTCCAPPPARTAAAQQAPVCRRRRPRQARACHPHGAWRPPACRRPPQSGRSQTARSKEASQALGGEACHGGFNRLRKRFVRDDKLERGFLALNHLAAAILAFRKVSLTIHTIDG
ncbi:hypothetical protein THIX_20802 [Thiomonas sp. X19]|nr:hypothetical protein THIX_20802 [Thiomonas sp. X19]